MFTIALTGGLASGKSTVARYFSELGMPVIDADQIAHKIMCDPWIIQEIIQYFGISVLTVHKQLHRPSLRELVFADLNARNFLEQLLHPLIYKEIQTSIQALDSLYCLVVIPLLFEQRTASLHTEKPASGLAIELNRIMLVMSPRKLQIERSQKRDQLEKKQIESILSAQSLPSEGIAKADDIIYNQTNLIHLQQFITRFHRLYLSLAQSAFLRYYLVPK